jgi:hypothetical protein
MSGQYLVVWRCPAIVNGENGAARRECGTRNLDLEPICTVCHSPKPRPNFNDATTKREGGW